MQIVIYSFSCHTNKAPADGAINFNQPTRGVCFCVRYVSVDCDFRLFSLRPSARDESRSKNKNSLKIHETISPNIWFSSLCCFVHTYSAVQVVHWVSEGEEKPNPREEKKNRNLFWRFPLLIFILNLLSLGPTATLWRPRDEWEREHEAIRRITDSNCKSKHLIWHTLNSDSVFPWIFHILFTFSSDHTRAFTLLLIT